MGSPGNPDANVERVRYICTQIGLQTEVLDLLNSEERCDWEHVLSRGELHALNLVRAFVSNFEVLCLEKPFLGLEIDVQHRVLRLLREFVDKRGIGNAESEIGNRRPRTCIFSTFVSIDMSRVDNWYSVSTETGIKQLGSAADATAIIESLNIP